MGPLRIPIRPVFEGLRGVPKGSYVRYVFGFRGQKGVLLGSYLRCLGRFGGSKRGVFEGSRGSLLRVLKVVRK